MCCQGLNAADGPNILLVTVDTMRRDALGILGNNRTPAIDGLAEGGALFSTAVSPMPLTLPAHTSLMTGLIPRRHGVRDNGRLVGAELRLLAQILAEQGYATSAFVSGFPLDRSYGLDRGFTVYDDELPSGARDSAERSASATTDRAVAWIQSAESPWFSWVHYYDPHDPYEPPREFWGTTEKERYYNEVQYVDFSLQKLFAAAKVQDQSVLTVLTSDHGESLGEHGEERHGFFLYDSTILVPLVFHWPGHIASSEIDDTVGLIDIMPTILQLIGRDIPADIDGVSLVPLIAGKTTSTRHVYAETRLPWLYFGWAPLEAVRSDTWKLIESTKSELYDLRNDPNELNNVITEEYAALSELTDALWNIHEHEPVESTLTTDPKALDKLRSLGYVGAGSAPQSVPDGLPAPAERIEMRRALLRADSLHKQGRIDEALAGFTAVLDSEPENRYALSRAGIALMSAGRNKEAIGYLQTAVRLDPGRAELRFALGQSLSALDRWSEAHEHWMELSRLLPRHYQAWANLGLSFARQEDFARAAEAMVTAYGLNPAHDRLLLDAVHYYIESGAEARAAQFLRSATAKNSDLLETVRELPRFRELLDE